MKEFVHGYLVRLPGADIYQRGFLVGHVNEQEQVALVGIFSSYLNV